MSLMGVKKINRLRECTLALPGKGDKPEPPVSVSSSSSLAKPSSSTTTATAASYKPTASTFYQSTTATVVSCAPGVKCNGGGGGGEHPHSGPTAALPWQTARMPGPKESSVVASPGESWREQHNGLTAYLSLI